MPSKKGNADQVESRKPLTAVVLADSFTQRFRPITLERPKVLLPLANVPMIEYTLEWLSANRVEEVFLFSCAHADQIRGYLKQSQWDSHAAMKIIIVESTTCTSAGEAMRIIDQKDIIKHDFILVSADTLSNMNIRAAMDEHLARREKDKSAILTLVLRECPTSKQRVRLGDFRLLTCWDPVTHRLLKYVEVDSGVAHPGFTLETPGFSDRDVAEVHLGMLDTGIAICSPDVLHLFSDNFDYQNLRRHLVPGVLSEEELGNKLYVHLLRGKEYGARVHNLRSYQAMSEDVVLGELYPFHMARNAFQSHSKYGYHAFLPPMYPAVQYIENVNSCGLFSNPITHVKTKGWVCIGKGTKLGSGCRLENSIIGSNCIIGRDVTIRNAFVMDGVVIQSGASITSAMVCDRVVVKEKAVVSPGVILACGVVIGSGHTVPEHHRVSLYERIEVEVDPSDDELEYQATGRMDDDDTDEDDTDEDDEDEGGYRRRRRSLSHIEGPEPRALRAAEALAAGKEPPEAVKFNEEVVGAGGAGYSWGVPEGLEMALYSIVRPPPGLEEGLAEDDDESGSVAGEEVREAGGVMCWEPGFRREVCECFLRCVRTRRSGKSFKEEDLKTELSATKSLENGSFLDITRYLFTTMLGLALPTPPRVPAEYRDLYPTVAPDLSTSEGKKTVLAAAKQQLETWKDLLAFYLKTKDDEVELLLTFEDWVAEEGDFEGEGGSAFSGLFQLVLKSLYDLDIVSPEAILTWADMKEDDDEEDKVLFNTCTQLIDWLREEEDDDEDEEDEDEDEDE